MGQRLVFNPFTGTFDWVTDPEVSPYTATAAGQLLCSLDGSTFEAVTPVLTEGGDLIFDENDLLVVM